MGDSQVTIRGTSEGLIIEFGSGDLESVLRELDRKLGQTASFFRGGRVALRVGTRVLNRDEIEALGHTLLRWGVTLWAVESDAVETSAAAHSLGLETDLEVKRTPDTGIRRDAPDGRRADRLMAASESESAQDDQKRGASSSSGILVKRTLRSGASIVHDGHIVVLGDVNAGAEVIAGGDIIVWGKLRGLAHAGAGGDESAVVCALRLLPSQLRIGTKVTMKPRDLSGGRQMPQTASVSGDDIIIQPWMESLVSQSESFSGFLVTMWQRIGRAFGKK